MGIFYLSFEGKAYHYTFFIYHDLPNKPLDNFIDNKFFS